MQLVYVLGDLALANSEFWKKVMSWENVRAPLEMQGEPCLPSAKRQTALANATMELSLRTETLGLPSGAPSAQVCPQGFNYTDAE